MKPYASPWGWNPKGRRRYALIALWLLHGAWVATGGRPGEGLRRAGERLSAPVRGWGEGWTRWKWERAERLRNLEAAGKEVDRLRTRVAELEIAAARQAPRLIEADEQARMLGLKAQLPVQLQAARVILNTRHAPFGGLILDQGADAGLKPDQGILVPEGVVGRIWSVSDTQCRVLPADAPNASMGVLLSRGRATGVLFGAGQGRAEIRYIGTQEIVQVGEPVLTSGLDRVFPRGLLVGWVTQVRPGPLELRISVQLAAPLDHLRTVLLLPPSPPLELQPPLHPAETKKGTQP